jgi:predicted signal transduction protein with EAL and GGDEF domain
VLRDADTAMYKAKGAGKARYAMFDASLHTEVARSGCAWKANCATPSTSGS